MTKHVVTNDLIQALVGAGLIDDPRMVKRVLIDIQGGQIPMVYVEKFGDPAHIATVVAGTFGPERLVPASNADGEALDRSEVMG
jgi:hypothetical protein